MADRTFTLKFVGDIADAKKSLESLDKNVSGFKDTTTTAFKAIGAAVTVGAVVEFGKAVVSSASDQEQAIGAVNSVFKDYAGTINDFGKTTAQNMGVSRAEFSQTAATMGALLKNAGLPMDQVAESTMNLSKRAADLASMYGGTVPDAMDAMKSALKGEFDPLEKYGISLKASSIEAKAVAMGLVDAEGKATAMGKAVAAQTLIMEQSADAQGNFAKESGTVAGQTERMKAQFADMQAEIGRNLLPILTKLATILNVIIGFVKDNQGWLIPLAAGIGAVVLAIKAWEAAQSAWAVATKVAAAAQWLWNAALTANPIGLIVVAIAAVIAILVLLYTKVGWFRDGVDAMVDGVVAAFQWLWDMIQSVYGWVKDNWPLLLAIITGPFGIAVAIIVRYWDAIKDAASAVIDALRWVFARVVDFITAPFRQAWEIVRGIWDTVTGFFSDIVGGIRNALTGLGEVIEYPFRIAFDAIKRLWNSTVGGFGFEVPSWVPGVGGKSFKIPRMATGGIVTRPTVALIGEAGPEAVVPLGRNGGGFGNVTINVYAMAVTAETGRIVYDALKEYERTSGRG